jgi:Papain-like cysteine protease AvrRpt2
MQLSFKIQIQLLPNWCWAAASSSISFFYDSGSNWYQPQLASKLLDLSCGNITVQNADQAPAVCNMEMDIAKAMSVTENYAGEFNRALTIEEIVSQINGGFPVCCQMVWPGSSYSHFVVLFGYSANDVIVGDPDATSGGVFQLDYNAFCSNYRNGGQWQRTIGSQAAS